MKARVWTDGYCEITDGARWWTGAAVPGGWLIVDHLGRHVADTDALGREILAAIAIAATDEPPSGAPGWRKFS